MNTNQLTELATNARLNHWPPHLGVRTEAEKVEYLAKALDEVTLRDAQYSQIKALEEEITGFVVETTNLKHRLDARDDKIEQLEAKVDDLTEENQRLRDELAAKERNV